MKPVPSMIVALLLLIVGLVPPYTMLTVQKRKVENPRRYIVCHKIAGYTFAVLALFMFATMILRARDYWFPNSPVDAIHVTLAFAFFFLLTVKIVAARFYKHLSGHMFSLGTAVYLVAFALIGLTASHHLVWRFTKKIDLSYRGEPIADAELGEQLLVSKCTRCHPLSDILWRRSPDAWRADVGRMMERAHSTLTVDEADLILQYLVENESPRPVQAGPGASPIERYCLPCHDMPGVLRVPRTRKEWEAIVTRMRAHGPDIIPEENIVEIAQFLLREQKEGGVPQSDRNESPR